MEDQGAANNDKQVNPAYGPLFSWTESGFYIFKGWQNIHTKEVTFTVFHSHGLWKLSYRYATGLKVVSMRETSYYFTKHVLQTRIKNITLKMS